MSAPQTPTISLATALDYPTLAAIFPLANAANPLDRFMFQHDVRKSTARDKLTPPGHQWAMAQFRAAEREAGKGGGDMGVKTYVLKAVVGGDGGTAVGFGVVRVVKQMGRVGGGEEEGDGEGEGEKGETGGLEADADADADANANEVLNRAFCDVYLLRLKGLYERHMGGREHAHWRTLMVHPAYQGQGIGTALITWALAHLSLSALPVWIVAQPDGYALYRRCGWKDVEVVDVDLGSWAGEGKGYGTHRTVCMVREGKAV